MAVPTQFKSITLPNYLIVPSRNKKKIITNNGHMIQVCQSIYITRHYV